MGLTFNLNWIYKDDAACDDLSHIIYAHNFQTAA